MNSRQVLIHPDLPRATAQFGAEISSRFSIRWQDTGVRCHTAEEAETIIAQKFQPVYPYQQFRLIRLNNVHPLYVPTDSPDSGTA